MTYKQKHLAMLMVASAALTMSTGCQKQPKEISEKEKAGLLDDTPLKAQDKYGAQVTVYLVDVPLYNKDGTRQKDAYMLTRALSKKDFANYQNTKQNIHLEVKQAYLNMVTAQESITVSKLSMEQAQEQYDMAAGRYKVGLGDAIELKDAETTFRNAQLDYYNSLLKYHVSAANLERVMGVPLETTDVDLL